MKTLFFLITLLFSVTTLSAQTIHIEKLSNEIERYFGRTIRGYSIGNSDFKKFQLIFQFDSISSVLEDADLYSKYIQYYPSTIDSLLYPNFSSLLKNNKKLKVIVPFTICNQTDDQYHYCPPVEKFNRFNFSTVKTRNELIININEIVLTLLKREHDWVK